MLSRPPKQTVVARQRRPYRGQTQSHGVAIRCHLPRTSGERLNINVKDACEIEQDGHTINGANPSLNLRQPRFRPPHQPCQGRLAHPATATVGRDPPADSRLPLHDHMISRLNGPNKRR